MKLSTSLGLIFANQLLSTTAEVHSYAAQDATATLAATQAVASVSATASSQDFRTSSIEKLSIPMAAMPLDAISSLSAYSIRSGTPNRLADTPSFGVSQTSMQIASEEPFHATAHLDSKGAISIGYGRVVDKSFGGSITLEEGAYLMESDLNRLRVQLEKHLPWVTRLSEARLGVLLNIQFQAGINGLLQQRIFLGHVEEGRYSSASTALQGSLWARQFPARAKRLSRQMSTDKWQLDGDREVEPQWNFHRKMFAQLRHDEGWNPSAYRTPDTNLLAVGVAKIIDASHTDGGVTRDEATFLLDGQIEELKKKLIANHPELARATPARRGVIIHLAFATSVSAVQEQFNDVVYNMELGMYSEAAEELMSTNWAKANQDRAQRLATQMKTNKFQFKPQSVSAVTAFEHQGEDDVPPMGVFTEELRV